MKKVIEKNDWFFEQVTQIPKLKDVVLIEGLPGIGNVGKVAIDFLITELKAKKLYDISSYSFPNSVFVGEDNLVDMLSIELYHKKLKGRDFLFLTGDIQPIDEQSCHKFCYSIIDIVKPFKPKEIITLGGIGLGEVPKKPRIFCTANNQEIVKRYKDKNLTNKISGVVGPIIGVSGLLLGIAKKHHIEAICLLVETLGHPAYIGIKESRGLIELLNKKLSLGMNIDKFNKEIRSLEAQLKEKTEDITKLTEASKKAGSGQEPTNYIG